jgi:zinc transport system permease protein
MKTLLMVLLAVSVVVAMKLAGVVLATALLVLPGAAALRLSRSLGRVLAISVGLGILGLIAGIILSTMWDWPPGPCMVLVLTLLFALAAAYESLMPGRRSDRPVTSPTGASSIQGSTP